MLRHDLVEWKNDNGICIHVRGMINSCFSIERKKKGS